MKIKFYENFANVVEVQYRLNRAFYLYDINIRIWRTKIDSKNTDRNVISNIILTIRKIIVQSMIQLDKWLKGNSNIAFEGHVINCFRYTILTFTSCRTQNIICYSFPLFVQNILLTNIRLKEVCIIIHVVHILSIEQISYVKFRITMNPFQQFEYYTV